MIVLKSGDKEIPADNVRFLLNLGRTVYELTNQEVAEQWMKGEITLYRVHPANPEREWDEWVFLLSKSESPVTTG